jgi:hypothetical protein
MAVADEHSTGAPQIAALMAVCQIPRLLKDKQTVCKPCKMQPGLIGLPALSSKTAAFAHR